MKTIIAGSSKISDYNIVETSVSKSDIDVSEVVSGCSKGVDKLGERYAELAGIPIKKFNPNWRVGKHAWKANNSNMAEYADAAIIIWDGKSKGTKHMIDEANNHGLTVFVHVVIN